jgi:hypothetical protein
LYTPPLLQETAERAQRERLADRRTRGLLRRVKPRSTGIRLFSTGIARAGGGRREVPARKEDGRMNDIDRLEQRLSECFEALHQRMEVLDRRADQRFTEIRAKQEEDIMLLKAMSCQLRGRVERVERRAGRGVT